MKAVILTFVFLSLVGLGYSWQYPRNADQTLWAFRTCQRRESDASLVLKWYQWQLPNNAATHCYVKCGWIHLGMYNRKDGSIKVDKVKQQFTSRGVEIPGDIDSLSGPTDGSCKTLYDKTIRFFKNNAQSIRFAFYGTTAESNKWFAEHPEVKPKGTKISQFCNAEREKGNKDCKHACSAYYYRLVDEDYKPIYFRKLEIPGISNDKINKCRKEASGQQGCKVSDALYDCLERSNAAGLKAALKILDDPSTKY
uniref:26.76 kDa salivary D7-related protein n=1 Tax=Phlebotomus sergenti TaxID=85759 RepID=F6K8S3_9DIPT